MGPSGRVTHVIVYIRYIGSIALFGTGICRFCTWVELPIQRRLCLIFMRNVGSPDIHECFRGLTGSQRTSGFGASQNIFNQDKNINSNQGRQYIAELESYEV